MAGQRPEIAGIVAVDEAGRVAFGAGLGLDPRVRSLAADRDWREEAVRRRLTALSLDRHAFAVLAAPMAGGHLLVLSPVSGAVLDFVGSVDFAYDILDHLLTDPFDAMTVVDAAARIVYISPVHESFFGLAHGEANGRPVRQVIENSRLDKVVESGRAEIGAIQRMKGLERVVSRIPIKRDGRAVGAVGRVMFKGPEQVEALGRRIKALESEVDFYRRKAAALQNRGYGLDDLIGDSPAMQRLRGEVIKVAPLEIPILIQGESGTGKELVAQSLHRLSPRRDQPLVMLNAAALPATLVEAELFGYEAGAFTGADRKGRKGKFEQAAGGTIFLDEIGDMPVEVQSKLLRVLQDRIVERIGSDRAREVDFRLITATNRDLQALVAENRFRLDLYYRVAPIVVTVPPLRERREDIALLVPHFLREVAERHGRPEPAVLPDALAHWMDQAWPGNVRQLRHAVERAFVFAENGRITVAVLDRDAVHNRPAAPGGAGAARTLRDAVVRTEADLVRDAMALHGGNKKRVAAALGISRSYLYKLLAETGG
ncbi:Anaerobic nitric oxide reductase transcription regulator NorR [Methylobacterium crusticola]|uniref:Anaerobic nitric oxide reductase transcription regulator NorR n=1 Tax=Methylobacterium crusticola TaxID=1697972 RepID=A0ABQ4R8K6_9HYPH|nr:sigma 54-interacting transcriptional regulator [Methylobacterium crusticola]GJD53106.1 Anaerobic nitric oxide reductase transcription regulator NorR [Methylobacterium crusticola]